MFMLDDGTGSSGGETVKDSSETSDSRLSVRKIAVIVLGCLGCMSLRGYGKSPHKGMCSEVYFFSKIVVGIFP